MDALHPVDLLEDASTNNNTNNSMVGSIFSSVVHEHVLCSMYSNIIQCTGSTAWFCVMT